MRRSGPPTLLVGLALGLASSASLGAPGSSAPTGEGAAAGASAEARYEQAQQHYIAGRHANALPIFRELAREEDSPNAWLYVARCLREMGRLVDAYEAMTYTAALSAARARTEPRFAGTAKAAKQEAAELEARIGRIGFDLPARPAGLEIEVNGKPISASRWDAPVPVTAGNARIWASAPGHAAGRQEVDVPAGSVTRVTIVLGRTGSAVPNGPQGAEPRGAPGGSSTTDSGTAPGPSDGSAAEGGAGLGGAADTTSGGGNDGLLAGGIVSLVVGVGGWVVMGVLGSKANERFDEIETQCNHQRCTNPALNDSIDEGQTWDTVANVGLAAGLVGTVLGGVLLTAYAVTSSDAEPDATAPAEPGQAPSATTAPSLAIVASPLGWLGLEGSF